MLDDGIVVMRFEHFVGGLSGLIGRHPLQIGLVEEIGAMESRVDFDQDTDHGESLVLRSFLRVTGRRVRHRALGFHRSIPFPTLNGGRPVVGIFVSVVSDREGKARPGDLGIDIQFPDREGPQTLARLDGRELAG